MKNDVLLIIIGLALLAVVWIGWQMFEGVLPGRAAGGDTVVCTADAKLCPDGSYVSRVPPECNFAACPGAQ